MKLSDSAREERETVIIKAAVKVIARHGYHSSKVSDIAKEAKIAYGLFYHYFESKDDVLLKIFQNSWINLVNEIDAIIGRTGDPGERLKQIINYMFTSYEYDSSLLKVLIMDVPRLDKFYDKKNLVLYKIPYAKIAEVIEEGRSKGIFKKKASPQIMAQIIMGAIDSIIRHDVYDIMPGKKSRFNAAETTNHLHAIIIDSIKK